MRFPFSFPLHGRFWNAAAFDRDEFYAGASLSTDGHQWTWTVACCPLCKARHVHGGGLVGQDDPRRVLSSRAAHCIGPRAPGRYTLVDMNPAETRRLLRLHG